jgi:hypothetical protein
LLAQVESNLKTVLIGKNFSYDAAGAEASCFPYFKISQVSLVAFISP